MLTYFDLLGVVGGMGHYTGSLVHGYVTCGHSVEVITASPSAGLARYARVVRSRAASVALDRRKPRVVRAASYLMAYLGVAGRATARNSEAVILHQLHQPIVDVFGLLLLRLARQRIVIVAHDPVPVLHDQRKLGYRTALRLADIVVVHGNVARRDALRFGVVAKRIVVAPFGDFEPAHPLARDDAARVLGLDGPPERPVAAIIGNLKPGKGIPRVVRSLSQAGGPVRTLLIVGTKQGHWNLDNALSLAKDARMNVLRVDRRMSDEEELAAYSLSDVVLALYDSGYSSGVVARAHAIGRPVVTTDVGDIPAQTRPPDLVIPRDYGPSTLADAIRRALDEPTPAAFTRDDRWRQHAALVTIRLAEL